MGEKIITEEVIIGIGVDHLKGKVEIGETIEA